MNKVLPLVCCVAAIFSVQIDPTNAYDSEIADILRKTNAILYDSTLDKAIPFLELKSSLDATAGDEVPRAAFNKGYSAANDYTIATGSFFRWCADAGSVIKYMDRNNMTKQILGNNMIDALMRLFQKGLEEANVYDRKLVQVFDQVTDVGLMVSHMPSARNIQNTTEDVKRALVNEIREVRTLHRETEAGSNLIDDFRDWSHVYALNYISSGLQKFVKRHAAGFNDF